MANNEFRILIDSLRIAMSGDDGSSIESSMNIVLGKYTNNWKEDTYSSQNLKKLYYKGLNYSAAQKIKDAVINEESFRKYIGSFSTSDKEAIAVQLQVVNKDAAQLEANEIPYFCVNLLNKLIKEAQQKKSTITSEPINNDVIESTIRDEKGTFEATFSQVKEVKLPSKSGMRVFALLPVNGIYSHKQLIRLLRKNLARYIFSRKDRTGEDVDLEELSAEATTELRKFVRECDPQTLLGELLVYIFLEHCENAPKIFTKAEFFRNTHSISERSIFIRKCGDGWQFIIGASNLGATLDLAISNALKGCEKLKDRSDYGEGLYSTNVIQRSALDSSFELEQVNQINSLILPKPDKLTPEIQIDSYGIFLGYQASDFNDNPEELKALLLRDAEKAERIINEFVSRHGLIRHPLYLYLLPFRDIEKESDLIIDQLVGR